MGQRHIASRDVGANAASILDANNGEAWVGCQYVGGDRLHGAVGRLGLLSGKPQPARWTVHTYGSTWLIHCVAEQPGVPDVGNLGQQQSERTRKAHQDRLAR